MMARGAPRNIQACPPILQPCLGGFSTETFFPALLESFRIQYLQFLAYTKTPQYKASLQQLLDQEKVRATTVCVPSILQGAYPEHALFPVTSPCPCSEAHHTEWPLWWHSEFRCAQPQSHPWLFQGWEVSKSESHRAGAASNGVPGGTCSSLCMHTCRVSA